MKLVLVETYAAIPVLTKDATNSQHATMYAFFFLAGLFDLFIYFGYAVPPEFDYITMALGFTVEGLLFTSHTHGRSSMELQVSIETSLKGIADGKK